jgi:hypothetical protein
MTLTKNSKGGNSTPIAQSIAWCGLCEREGSSGVASDGSEDRRTSILPSAQPFRVIKTNLAQLPSRTEPHTEVELLKSGIKVQQDRGSRQKRLCRSKGKGALCQWLTLVILAT